MADQTQNLNFSGQGAAYPIITPDHPMGWMAAQQGFGNLNNTIGGYLAQRQQEQQKLAFGIALAQGQAQAEQQAKMMAQQQDPVYQLRMKMMQQMGNSGMFGGQSPMQNVQGSQPMPQGQAVNFNPMNPIQGGQAESPSQFIMNPNFAFGGNEPYIANPEFKSKVEADNRPATQFQETTGLYANRLEQANKVFDNLEKFTNNMNPGDQAQIGLPNFLNTFKSSEVQSYQQAEKNFINAVLRRESGATINPSELQQGREQYIPQPGDKPSTLTQKKANRLLAMNNFVKSSGNAYTPYADPLGQQSSGNQIPSREEIMAELQRRQQAQR